MEINAELLAEEGATQEPLLGSAQRPRHRKIVHGENDSRRAV